MWKLLSWGVSQVAVGSFVSAGVKVTNVRQPCQEARGEVIDPLRPLFVLYSRGSGSNQPRALVRSPQVSGDIVIPLPSARSALWRVATSSHKLTNKNRWCNTRAVHGFQREHAQCGELQTYLHTVKTVQLYVTALLFIGLAFQSNNSSTAEGKLRKPVVYINIIINSMYTQTVLRCSLFSHLWLCKTETLVNVLKFIRSIVPQNHYWVLGLDYYLEPIFWIITSESGGCPLFVELNLVVEASIFFKSIWQSN